MATKALGAAFIPVCAATSIDALEASYNALLMLDAEPEQAIDAKNQEFSWLDRDKLADDEGLLRQVYGLLANAHYRTRPLDLRQLLDGPNIRIATVRAGQAVLAACLIADEGPLTDSALNAEIIAGRRRPSGHLLPQILMQRLHLSDAATQRYWRIIRIAVQPELQQQTIGSELLRSIEDSARAEGVDSIGSTFAVDLPVLQFWQRAGYRAVLLGDNCEATSGSYALTILRPLTDRSVMLLQQAKTVWETVGSADLSNSHPALSDKLREQVELALQQDVEAPQARN